MQSKKFRKSNRESAIFFNGRAIQRGGGVKGRPLRKKYFFLFVALVKKYILLKILLLWYTSTPSLGKPIFVGAFINNNVFITIIKHDQYSTNTKQIFCHHRITDLSGAHGERHFKEKSFLIEGRHTQKIGKKKKKLSKFVPGYYKTKTIRPPPRPSPMPY